MTDIVGTPESTSIIRSFVDLRNTVRENSFDASLGIQDVAVPPTYTSSALKTYYSATRPTGLNMSTDVGSVWVDTTTAGHSEWWDGYGWINPYTGEDYHGGTGFDALGPGITRRGLSTVRLYNGTTPGSPSFGWMVWVSGTSTLTYWNGSAWTTITDTNLKSAANTALTQSGNNLADGYITLWYQTGPPTVAGGAQAGDLWYDSDDNFADYRFDGTYWNGYDGGVAAPTGTDGHVPSSSPTPSILAGFGSYFVTWTAISNNDPVTYNVYMCPSSALVGGAVPTTPSRLIGSTDGTFAFTNKDPNTGAALVDSTTYYFAIIAVDDDGPAPVSASVSGGSVRQQIIRTQITDNAIDTPQLNANAVTAGIVATNAVYAGAVQATAIDGKTITGALIRTASSGRRLVMDGLSATPSFQAWDSSGNQTVGIDGVTNFLYGTFKTALTGARAEILTSSSIGVLNFYLSTTTTPAKIQAISTFGSSLSLTAPLDATRTVTPTFRLDAGSSGNDQVTIASSTIDLDGDVVVPNGRSVTIAKSVGGTGGNLVVEGGINVGAVLDFLKSGVKTINVTALNSTMSATVTFATAFPGTGPIPNISVTPVIANPTNATATISSVSRTGFTINLVRTSGATGNMDVHWIASTA